MRSRNSRPDRAAASRRTSHDFIARVLASTATALILTLPQAALQPAAAQMKTDRVGTTDFDIPAQPLSAALNAFGRQRVTGVYDLADPDRALQALVQPFGGRVRSVSPVLRVLSRI